MIDNPQIALRNQLHTQTNFVGLTRGHEMLAAPTTGSLDLQDAAMIFQNAPSAKSGIIAAAGSIFFDQSTLKMLVDQRFEYQHSGSTQNNDVSIFKSMEILMSDRASLPDNYMAQSDFMEMIKLAIRGECNP